MNRAAASQDFMPRHTIYTSADVAPAGSRRYGPRPSMTTSTASRTLPWALIGAACLGSFAATSSGTTRAPFLLEMSHDLGVSMPLVANLVSMTATAWGFTSAFGGWMSDRIGRRALLV